MDKFFVTSRPSRTALAVTAALLSFGVHATMATPAAAPAEVKSANTLVTAETPRYQPSIYPDRVTLLPGSNASNTHQVTWRTDASVANSVLQITVAQPTPGLHLTATELTGELIALETPNGKAHHHRVQLANLTPDTLYAYRVKGGDTWSNWHQFRTPAATFEPYTALYFGDAQNAVYSHYSRTVREATTPSALTHTLLWSYRCLHRQEQIYINELATHLQLSVSSCKRWFGENPDRLRQILA